MTDPSPQDVLDRLRDALTEQATAWEETSDRCLAKLDTHCLVEHEHCGCAGDDHCDDHCLLEPYVEDSDDVEWDTMSALYREAADALRALLARDDPPAPSGTTVIPVSSSL